ncbi:MAG TPA: hypothetical protein VJN67_06480, partial [Stellaceae bacterium]|nr:hypothetical protein [Stellaceae bacterium]
DMRPDIGRLPAPLQATLLAFAGPAEASAVLERLRDPDKLMTAPRLGAMKATRLSFANILARHMISEGWTIRRERFGCDAEGDGHGIYRIEANGHALTYIARTFRWDGIEKVGRRSDGAKRDMFGAIFVGNPTPERIAEEFATFELRDAAAMRTRSDVTGWTPANRSVRYFDHVVNSLVSGQQPDPAVLGSGTGYVLRNGGYLGSGRQGSLSVDGYPPGHPLRHPYFGDLFGLYMVRQVAIDLVNGVARARNPRAAQLAPDVARYIGVGNSSGQGMCVALQRWPEWVATWLLARELALAYAATRRPDPRSIEQLDALLSRAATYYGSIELQCEDYVVPPARLAAGLSAIRSELPGPGQAPPDTWGEVADRVEAAHDLETAEQFNSLLIELHPDFADAVAGYVPVGMWQDRDVRPEASVEDVQRLLQENYSWALRRDFRHSGARQHFWYHSADNGEQRRGERILDPHEEFESFIDHIGLVQHLSGVLATYDRRTPIAEVLVDKPDLFYGLARVQYLAKLPYAEFRDNLIDRAFIPAQLIRFFLSVLGMECTTPLSIRYVRGVFFQGMPLPDEIRKVGAGDWRFPLQPRIAEEASVA